MSSGVGLLLSLAALAACSAPPPGSDSDGRVDDNDAVVFARDTRRCIDDVPLVIAEDPLGPVRLYALARDGSAQVALLVDTGSQVSFLSTPPGSPDFQPLAGELGFGCAPRPFAGRPYSAASEQDLAGYPVVGFLGADYFLERSTRIDLERRRIARVDSAKIASTAVALPYADVKGYLFVDVRIDDVLLTLGFDTGASHSLWIGVDGQPGDQPVQSVDGFGNPIVYFLGSGQMIAGDSPARTVPVLRVLSHPSIEASNEAIGIDAQGLFGLTSIPGRSIVIEPTTSTIWLE